MVFYLKRRGALDTVMKVLNYKKYLQIYVFYV